MYHRYLQLPEGTWLSSHIILLFYSQPKSAPYWGQQTTSVTFACPQTCVRLLFKEPSNGVQMMYSKAKGTTHSLQYGAKLLKYIIYRAQESAACNIHTMQELLPSMVCLGCYSILGLLQFLFYIFFSR